MRPAVPLVSVAPPADAAPLAARPPSSPTFPPRRLPELEDLNAECQGALSRECHLDAVAARNVLKVALASQVVLAARVVHEAECARPTAIGDAAAEDPYASLADLEDACPPGYARALPAATAGATALDRVVACGEDADAECDVDEMLRMVAGAERSEARRACVQSPPRLSPRAPPSSSRVPALSHVPPPFHTHPHQSSRTSTWSARAR